MKKLSEIEENSTVVGIAKIKNEWIEIKGFTQKTDRGIILVTDKCIYENQDMEIET